MNTHVYIDGANLHKGSLELNFELNYKKLRGWLRQKYGATKVYIFLGLIPKYTKLYEYLQECGYILVFKETSTNISGETKGNCDAELVLKAVSDFYTKLFNQCVIITGDGDFACLVEFLQKENVLKCVLAPNKTKCSFLLRNKSDIELTFLNEHYHKFSSSKSNLKEKAPDEDESSQGSFS